jgi:hypothetical protein
MSLPEHFVVVAPPADQQSLQNLKDALEKAALPEAMLHALQELVAYLAQGQSLALVPTTQKLTTEDAADILNVPVTYLNTLLDTRVLAFTQTHDERFIIMRDLLAYKGKRDQERKEGLAAMAQLSQEMGIYDE